jgi:hypothetical protein
LISESVYIPLNRANEEPSGDFLNPVENENNTIGNLPTSERGGSSGFSNKSGEQQ